MNLRVAVTGEAKGFSPVPAVKASLKRAFIVGGGRRETK